MAKMQGRYMQFSVEEVCWRHLPVPRRAGAASSVTRPMGSSALASPPSLFPISRNLRAAPAHWLLGTLELSSAVAGL